MTIGHLNIQSMILTMIVAFSSLFFDGCAVHTAEEPSVANDFIVAETAVNINTASTPELEAIPFIGKKIAHRIVEFRATNGPFRRPEHLMLVPGISDKRFRQIRSFIKTE
jgi:competence protein ComEA